MTRPYLIEILMPEPAALSGESTGEDASCQCSCALMRALAGQYNWLDPEARVVSEVEIGTQHWAGGRVFLRVLVHARIPLEEVVEPGEHLVVRPARREVFEAEGQIYYVTKLIEDVMAKRCRDLEDLLQLDPIDVHGFAEVLAARLQAPRHSTDDLYPTDKGFV